MLGYALFDTAIGKCGIAWGERGIVGVQLPEAREAATRETLLRRFPEAREAPPPPGIAAARDGIVALLAGKGTDLGTIALDMGAVPAFHRRVYEAARAIPPGATLSYGDIAARTGSPGAARAVGQALGRNPFPLIVPCHRVLAAGGKVGGFSANGGIATKLRLLAIEGADASGRYGLLDGEGFDARAALEHLGAADPALARLIDEIGPFHLRREPAPSVFAALAQAIVYQQLTGKAAGTIHARLLALFPRAHKGLTPQHVLGASDAKLRSAGLSQAKMLSLRDLAKRTAAGEIPELAEIHRFEDEEIVARLSEVRGIGRWTAEMLLIFRLGRPDVLPADDYGVRKGFARAFNKRAIPTPKEVLKRGERWRPYRSVASWYLWRAADLAPKPRPSAARKRRLVSVDESHDPGAA